MTTIPSRCPVVKVERHEQYPAGSLGKGYAAPLRTWWEAHCHVDGCTWTSGMQAVKVAAEEQARWHRHDHRSAATEAGSS